MSFQLSSVTVLVATLVLMYMFSAFTADLSALGGNMQMLAPAAWAAVGVVVGKRTSPKASAVVEEEYGVIAPKAAGGGGGAPVPSTADIAVKAQPAASKTAAATQSAGSYESKEGEGSSAGGNVNPPVDVADLMPILTEIDTLTEAGDYVPANQKARALLSREDVQGARRAEVLWRIGRITNVRLSAVGAAASTVSSLSPSCFSLPLLRVWLQEKFASQDERFAVADEGWARMEEALQLNDKSANVHKW